MASSVNARSLAIGSSQLVYFKYGVQINLLTIRRLAAYTLFRTCGTDYAMITCRTAQQCCQVDFGWLQTRYTISFGHYFDPAFLHYASLQALNQEVLAVGAVVQLRTYPLIDVLNIVLHGEAEYRDSNGHAVRVAAGKALMLAAQPVVSYS